ncbi:MAG: hypothetical protein KAS23_16290 [Anaerohalosphaera sp.]|nr:hypothetical protein [Anaerohalosphaera sp.]
MNESRVKLIPVVTLFFFMFVILCISAQAEDPDYGDGYNTAEPVDPNGVIIEGVIADDPDQDWFSFTASADGLYDFWASSQTGTKRLYVYKLDEFDQLQQIDYFTTPSGGSTSKQIFIQEAGTCYVKVQKGSSIGLYRFSITEVDTYPMDFYADTCSSPDMLIPDGVAVYDGITDYGMDEDWFTFQTTALREYRIDFYRPGNTDVQYQFKQDGCGGDSIYAGTIASRTFVSWNGDDYDLRLYSQTHVKEGYYEISVTEGVQHTDDHGNTYDAATPVDTNATEVEGVLDYEANYFTDVDWFSFTASADGLYDFWASSQTGTKRLYVYKLDEFDQLQQIDYFTTPSGGSTSKQIFIQEAGTCYVKVQKSSQIGLYRFSITSPEPYCGDLLHPYPAGDVNENCIVDLEDFAILAGNWLKDNRPE